MPERLTGAALYAGRPGYCGGPIEGAGEAVRASVIGLVVIPWTRVAGYQTSAGKMTCHAGNCREEEETEREQSNSEWLKNV